MGFLRPATNNQTTWKPLIAVVSIPSWVFSVLRPYSPATRQTEVSPRFNPVVGFLRPATNQLPAGPDSFITVSIPSWVFSVLRPRRKTPVQPTTSFNPVVGFLRPATVEIDGDIARVSGFQSRRGFSPSCDLRGGVRGDPRARVSIPSWVFSVLRQYSGQHLAQHRTSFNPVVGFLRPATAAGRRSGKTEACVSIPSWVFSVLRRHVVVVRLDVRDLVSIPSWVFSVLRRINPTGARNAFKFQSRRGFSPSCDLSGELLGTCRGVSIPSWVFSVLRPLAVNQRVVRVHAFQSRRGFSPSCDLKYRPVVSVLDNVSIPSWVFSVLRPTFVRGREVHVRCVSIPSWVFSVLRPMKTRSESTARASFNPVVGFLRPATSSGMPSTGLTSLSFNPVVGFLRPATPSLRVSP